jgi:signal transduction histidine kinase
MLRRLGIRGKVLAALSVPVLVLFLMAGALSWSSIRDAQTARTVTTLLTALEQSRQLADALAPERREAVGLAQAQDLLGTAVSFAEQAAALHANRGTYEASQPAVDEAAAAMFTVLNGMDLTTLDPRVEAEVGLVREALTELESIRERVAADDPPPMIRVLDDYDGVADDILAFPQRVGDALDDRQVAAILTAHALVTSTADHYAREQALGSELLLLGEPDDDLMTQVATLLPSTDLEFEDAKSSVAALDLGEGVFVPPLGASFNNFQDFKSFRVLVATGDVQNLRFTREADWTSYAQEEIDALDPVQSELRIAEARRADSTASASMRSAIATIGISLAAVVLSIITALAIARQIVRPLRRLTEAAGLVRDELPHLVEQVAIPGQGPDLRLTRIPVESRDEIGRLATAFNEVNATTIEVAQEQAALRASIAEMFVNVARRDQVLLNRQLSFIDALERSEEDPKTLADLFRLDHLATRMRRNAESLLILAGIDTGRRLREALPTSDVIRTASSEIEHYERIQLDLPVDPMMLGHTALPAAHMLAEVLENATVFSDPGTPVHVSTGIDESSVIVTIHDQGLGMAPEDLVEANARIHTTSASDVLGAQRLGLYVVGRIAARLGTTVELTRGPDDKGTLVTVRMPLVLFVDPQSIPLTPPTQHGRVETFVDLEEAAAVVHDTTYAPAPADVQDVAAGAYGSAENPAEAVDIEALIEGETEVGLPKRRSHGAEAPTWDMSGGDSASAPAIPLAPTPESLAEASLSDAGAEVWQPPIIEASAPLSPRRRAEAIRAEGQAPAFSSGGTLPSRTPAPTDSSLPARGSLTGGQPPVPQSGVGQPTASGLPSRQRSVPAAPTASGAVDTASATGPKDVEGRTAMFQGFRSRRAELAAAAVTETGDTPEGEGPTDAVERLAVAATGAAAFFRRPEVGPESETETEDAVALENADQELFVIPSLVDDEDEFGDAAFAPEAPEVTLEQLAHSAQPEPTAAAVQAQQGVPWQPVVADQPADEWPPVAEAWAGTAEAGAPSWPPQVAAAEPAAESFGAPVAGMPAPTGDVSPWVGPETSAPAWSPDVPAAPAAYAAAPAQPPTYEPSPQPAAATPQGVQLPPPYEPFPYQSTIDFAELVQGPTRRSMRETPKVRRWFRRPPKSDAYEQAADAQAPVRAPAPAPAPAPLAPPVFARPTQAPLAPPVPTVESPVRQSAWGAPIPGSHSVDVPSARPVAPVPPAAPMQPVAPVSAMQPGDPVEGPWVPQLGWVGDDAPKPVVQSAGRSISQPQQPQEAWPQPAKRTPVPPVAEPVASAPVAPAPVAPAPVAPAPVMRPAQLPTRASAPANYAQTTFTPQAMFGFDDEMTNMLAQRADIAQQALAELNQLSMYRPQAVSSAAAPSTLTRRTPGNIPAAPAIVTSATPRPARDANQVRSLLSSFQSGSSRGRQLAGGGSDAASNNAGGNGLAGSEEGPDSHGEPVTTPDTDLTPRDTTW